MAKTEVILVKSVPDLGGESDRVSVAAGYARNYLIPRGLAVPLTEANARRLEVLKQRRSVREAHELTTMNELAKSLHRLVLMITVKTGDDGRMFGSITSGNIVQELKTQFEVDLDRRKLHLDQPIRSIGDHSVDLRLHPEVSATLKVRVKSSNPIVAEAEAAKAAEEKAPTAVDPAS